MIAVHAEYREHLCLEEKAPERDSKSEAGLHYSKALWV